MGGNDSALTEQVEHSHSRHGEKKFTLQGPPYIMLGSGMVAAGSHGTRTYGISSHSIVAATTYYIPQVGAAAV